MSDPFLVIGAMIALAVLYVMLPVFLDVFMRYRKGNTVTCPRRSKEASVSIDAEKAALTALTGKPRLRAKNCSLWTDEEFCNQECLGEL